MRINFFRSICIAAIIAGILLLAALSGMVLASAEKADNGCEPAPCQDSPAIPLCCFTADCPLSHCISDIPFASKPLPPGRYVPKDDSCPAWYPKTLTPEASANQYLTLPRAPLRESPSNLFTEHRCRNCLPSEEPLQV